MKAISRPSPGVSAEIHRGRLEARLGELLEQTSGEDVESRGSLGLRALKLQKETELLEVRVRRLRDSLVSRQEMIEQGKHVAALIEAELGLMAGDVPGRLAGADEATIREQLEARFAELVNRVRNALQNGGLDREKQRRTQY